MNEIIEMARIFADAKLAPTIHIHNVHDNRIDKYFAAAEPDNQRDTQETQTETPHLQDRLFYELGADTDRYNAVVSALNMCVRPCDLGLFVRPLLKEKDGRTPRRFFTAAFAELFVPHLTRYEGKLTAKCLVRNL